MRLSDVSTFFLLGREEGKSDRKEWRTKKKSLVCVFGIAYWTISNDYCICAHPIANKHYFSLIILSYVDCDSLDSLHCSYRIWDNLNKPKSV
jgi:hypothetical protein